MRHRSRLSHPSILIPLLLACAALASPAAAQHCWPSSVALLVRDERGALADPAQFEVSFTPERPDSSDQAFQARRLTGNRWGRRVPAGTHALQ